MLCQIGLPPVLAAFVFAITVGVSLWLVSQLLDYADVEEISNRELTKFEQISLMQFVN